MRLYSSIEEIVTWGHGGSHVHTLLPPDDATPPSPPPPPPNQNINLHLLELGSFVKINLLESSKLDL